MLGVVSRGIRAPIIKQGDDLRAIVVDTVLKAAQESSVTLQDRDVVCITESVVARAQGNYASTAAIAADVRAKTGGGTVGLVFPIMSRNRFSMLLKGIAQGVDKVVIQLSYPADEQGDALFPIEELLAKNINPHCDNFTEVEFRKHFPSTVLKYTGVDYINLYKDIAGPNCEIVLSNDPAHILAYTDVVIAADIHSRGRTKQRLLSQGARTVLCLDDLLTASVDGSGFQPQFGLLGSNLARDDQVKLFPRDSQALVEQIQADLLARTGRTLEVMVFGDGAFKDPVGGIWELADPVVSPGFTAGLGGLPNEIKLKYAADNELDGLRGPEAEQAMRALIRRKSADLVGSIAAQGTTPRALTDLLGSLADLTTGSGDKGTPFVLIQNYFKSYAE
ncbi:F420-0:Gamma-glutamyl ligase superfamily protein [Spironucleus salmonicida]|uniref:F420-0:Gamma-glutamyl ligase superfamily protein n=1 Tax=Spironucleus salmonicida TaxID=348837 RepID=V6LV43_9EUKA|nr:F420-0:Gamma-glutamyl ligase superfamily protein [Spironucleus salmonicida]KAH0575357.1 F420-0:Gamma-glutamyl ligase superfamily protein [Spironucleus salmonicida]KAH0575361.1 F420-0:Gamma-glutamyl ligase superfamily protein [Spironucleus salmonicida]|eukprot:EST47576.1 F420-0:Gamma-glutamyl ligase superfamily protein [Spironucleus salmonicida]